MTRLRPRSCKFVSLAVLFGHFAWSSTTQGFPISLPDPSKISGASTPTKNPRCSLFVDDGGNGGEFSRETIESSKTNNWGIPDSQTLDPLSRTPVDRLENGSKITLVGSGPGDPDLLTVKALKLLQDPNALVICDRLVSQEIVDLVKGEIKTARKLPGCADLAQEEIYWWTYQGLKAGKHVIRLKIGDPFVFGRGGEEILTFRRFGVEATVVPVSTRDGRTILLQCCTHFSLVCLDFCDRAFRQHSLHHFWETFLSLTGASQIKLSCAPGMEERELLRI
jgi:Tetrapyrrole (Corrin/Porphyrin) Methylases